MPKPLGALWSMRASGVIGGHRRPLRIRIAYAPFHMPLIGALVPGILSTGIKDPEVPYHGDSFIATLVAVRVSVAPQGANVAGFVRRNGVNIAVISVSAGAKTSLWPVSLTVSDGDWFDVNLTVVGQSPNEGADLVWIVTGSHVHP